MTEVLAFKVISKSDFETTLQTVIDALQSQGFGVLTRIDVSATMKEKLDVEFRPYVILGACNPPLAHRALTSDPDIGIMLPCNVTIEQTEQGSIISLANPAALLTAGEFSDNDEMLAVAQEARARIEKVAAQLSN